LLADARYLRINGRPLLLVYCAQALPDPRRWFGIWREQAKRAGHPDLYLAGVESVHQAPGDPRGAGLDAAGEFPPHWTRSDDVTNNGARPLPMAPRNAFYAQSGGVTAVINASAAGVIETARAHRSKIGRVLAGRNGIIGALTEDLIDTGKESARDIRALASTP